MPRLRVADEEAVRGLAEHCGVLGFLYTRQGRLLEARALLEESVAPNRELGYRETLVVALERLGALARALGDLELERQVAGELERQEGVGRP